MLPQPVEGLVLLQVEDHTPRQGIALILGHTADVHANLAVGHTEGCKRLAVTRLGGDAVTFRVEETHLPRLLADHRLHAAGADAHLAALVADGVLRLGRLLHHHQALRLLRQLVLRCGLHADDGIAHHLQAYHAGPATVRPDDDVAISLLYGGCQYPDSEAQAAD